ncbi:hypothetical protein [Trinickia dinghuensis]|uniref:Uncharacterized protein n=1 Tax=Trinickia dinghuensis TaxID=2291023 RepID=A0A3D8K063_9BURK|nr:hypothetical protein [Trinickia dinghuensis]RDU98296.1 hypothetical protein DWV00_13335 [Trinickia dinghuensis]
MSTTSTCNDAAPEFDSFIEAFGDIFGDIFNKPGTPRAEEDSRAAGDSQQGKDDRVSIDDIVRKIVTSSVQDMVDEIVGLLLDQQELAELHNAEQVQLLADIKREVSVRRMSADEMHMSQVSGRDRRKWLARKRRIGVAS